MAFRLRWHHVQRIKAFRETQNNAMEMLSHQGQLCLRYASSWLLLRSLMKWTVGNDFRLRSRQRLIQEPRTADCVADESFANPVAICSLNASPKSACTLLKWPMTKTFLCSITADDYMPIPCTRNKSQNVLLEMSLYICTCITHIHDIWWCFWCCLHASSLNPSPADYYICLPSFILCNCLSDSAKQG